MYNGAGAGSIFILTKQRGKAEGWPAVIFRVKLLTVECLEGIGSNSSLSDPVKWSSAQVKRLIELLLLRDFHHICVFSSLMTHAQ